MNYLAIGIHCLLGTVFLVSFIGKAAGRNAINAFVNSVHDMHLLPQDLVKPVALTVVAAELTVFALLVIPAPVAATVGFGAAAGLLIIFTISIALTLRRGARTPCLCFGVSTTPLGIRHIVRNAALVAAAMVGAAITPVTGPMELGGVAVALFGGLTLGGLVTVFDDMVELFRPTAKTSDAARSLL